MPQPISGIDKKEIESHSSALFNKRIDFLWSVVNNAEMDCTTALIPTVQSAMAYNSTLFTMFMETAKMYESNSELNKAIETCVKTGMKLSMYLKGSNPQQIGVETMIRNCLQWRYLMQTGMHNMNYFLRMSFREPRGIKEILQLFKGGDMNEIPGHSEQLRDEPKKES